jgi:hypothetical protein
MSDSVEENLPDLGWQPLCWKCSKVIKAPDLGGPFINVRTGTAFQMIGCKMKKAINDYESAKEHCPLHPDRREVDEDGRLIAEEE